MKKKLYISILALFLPLLLAAQGTVNELESDFGARFSAGIDKRLVKGLHLGLEEEIRLKDNFGTLGRAQTGLGISYKINKTFKVGAGYIFIDRQNSAGEWKMRHRFFADASVSFRYGAWRLSVKERLQLTHREVGNSYQNNPNSLALKSRIKLSYKGFNTWAPYGYAELRNVFNDPSCKAVWSTVSNAYSDYEFGGYDDAYINRVRGCLGVEWKLNEKNSLDFYLLGDYCYDKNIDVNSSQTRLKSLTWDQAFKLNVGVGYTFSF